MYLLYKTRKNKTYGILKRKKKKTKNKNKIVYKNNAYIWKYTNQKLFTHTNKNITYKCTHTITQHAPVYTTTANTTMTHSFRNYIQRVGTLHVIKGGAFFVYIQWL